MGRSSDLSGDIPEQTDCQVADGARSSRSQTIAPCQPLASTRRASSSPWSEPSVNLMWRRRSDSRRPRKPADAVYFEGLCIFAASPRLWPGAWPLFCLTRSAAVVRVPRVPTAGTTTKTAGAITKHDEPRRPDAIPDAIKEGGAADGAHPRPHCARIGVLGLGEGGLPLAVDLAGAGFTITAFDTDQALVASINNGRSQLPDVVRGGLEHLVGRGKFSATSETAALANLDIVSVCIEHACRLGDERGAPAARPHHRARRCAPACRHARDHRVRDVSGRHR